MSTNFTVWCNVELGEFLLARTDEDEAIARRTGGGAWHDVAPLERKFTEGGFSQLDAAHIIRHDPARVLAECEAKRRIVADRDMFAKMADDAKGDLALLATSRGIVRGLDHAIATLALAHAGHPDWREEWRP